MNNEAMIYRLIYTTAGSTAATAITKAILRLMNFIHLHGRRSLLINIDRSGSFCTKKYVYPFMSSPDHYVDGVIPHN